MGRKPSIIIERVYSDDPADWEAVAEELAKILISLAAQSSRQGS